ncbi:MAG: hypothetical protein ISR51_09975 [Rhodospirillales bacterium]|nr:hypothetical protein [Rhodospirillales bacterium]
MANSDMDLLSVYEALLINAGQPIVPVALNGYGYFLPLAAWFQVFDWLGLVPVHDMPGLLASADFGTAYAALIKAGRWFSVFQAWILAGLMYVGVYALFENQGGRRWAALLLSGLFAIGGGGLAAQSVMLRPELMATVLIFAAALALIAAPKATYNMGLWLLGLSGACIHVALMAKIQSVIVIMFLPLLPLVFGWWDRHRPTLVPPPRHRIAVLAAAVVLGLPVAIVFAQSLASGSSGLYQALIGTFVIACALVYGLLNLGGAGHGVVGLGAVVIGFSLAYGLVLFNSNWWVTYSVVNFLELMSTYSPGGAVAAAAPGAGGLEGAASPHLSGTINKVAHSLIGGFSITEITRFLTERLRNIDYPFAVFYLLVPAATVILAKLKKWEAAVKSGYLCLMAGLIVAVFWLGRGFFNFLYSVYVEVWVALAAAIVLRALASMATAWTLTARRLGLLAIAGLIAAVVTLNVSFRLTDLSAANPTTPKSACFFRGLTPMIYDKFDAYCGTDKAAK